MANLAVKNASGTTEYLKGTGAGTDLDPKIVEHKETSAAAIAASVASVDTKTPALGQALAAASVPVVLTAAQITTLTPPAAITGYATSANQTAAATLTGAVDETAPATDTASSGLNGRLQRIAQRITSLIALIPAALTGSGNFKVAVQEALPAGDNNFGNVDVASVAIPGTFYMGQKTVTTAGTELALASSQALLSGVTVKALHANTGWIYVGTNPVTSTTGFVLDAGEQVFIETDNLADVYIDSSVSGEGVSYLGS